MENKKYIGPLIKLRPDNDVNWNTSSVIHGNFDPIEDYNTNNTEYIAYQVEIKGDEKTTIKPFYFNYICNKCNKPVKEYTWECVKDVISRFLQEDNHKVSVDDITILNARKCHISYHTIYRMRNKPTIIDCICHNNCEIETKGKDTVECEMKVATLDTVNKNNRIYYSKACIVCGEGIRLTEKEEMCLQYGHHIDIGICDKCKQAVLHIRKQLEENNKNWG